MSVSGVRVRVRVRVRARIGVRATVSALGFVLTMNPNPPPNPNHLRVGPHNEVLHRLASGLPSRSDPRKDKTVGRVRVRVRATPNVRPQEG